MLEKAKVIKKEDKYVYVKLLVDNLKCSNCVFKKSCSLYLDPGERLIKIYNNLDAEPGDIVEVYLSSTQTKSSLILFFLPLLSFFVFFFIYYEKLYKIFSNKPTQLGGSIAGLFGIAIVYFLIYLWDRKKKKISDYIVKIIERKNE